jgi:hypothetical protein
MTQWTDYSGASSADSFAALGIDPDLVIRRLGGDAMLFHAACGVFVEDQRRLRRQLDEACAARDAVALAAALHAVKSAVCHFTQGPLYVTAAALEALARSGDADALVSALPGFLAGLERMRLLLDEAAGGSR